MHAGGAFNFLCPAHIVFDHTQPYLIVYWPGLIFGDSLSSLSQALGSAPLEQSSPCCLYSFLEMCLKFSEAFGLGSTVGVGPSSVSQGLIMAFAFAYMTRWISVRGNSPFLVSVIMALVFGLSSYIATYSVAL